MIYLDYQATTPLAPEAAEAMRPWLEAQYGNPHSSHRLGRQAAAAVEVAREDVLATLLHREAPADPDPPPELDVPWIRCDPPWDATPESGRLFFTSGATEALNWAIKGSFAKAAPDRRRIVTIVTEHAAVLDSVRWLESQGAELVILPVGPDGLIAWQEAVRAVDYRTAMVIAMYVNNEIGTVQQAGLRELSRVAREVRAPFICDNVQGFGRMSVPVTFCDMIAISAHKVHGPKGIGALWVRKGFEPEPLLHGGGQEGGLRSGTLSPALCAGFGEAAKLARLRHDEDWQHVRALYDQARTFFSSHGWHVNGSRLSRSPANINVWREGLDSSRLISELRDIAFSAGSACASGSGRPSHVLKALGLTDAKVRASIRLGFGRYTSEEELGTALQRIEEAAERQRIYAA